MNSIHFLCTHITCCFLSGTSSDYSFMNRVFLVSISAALTSVHPKPSASCFCTVNGLMVRWSFCVLKETQFMAFPARPKAHQR